MTNRLRYLLLVVLTPACFVDEGPEVGETTSAILAPPGYGHYCSKLWGSSWAFAWNSGANDDPCGWLDPKSTGTVARAGIYAVRDWNHVVTRCDGGFVSNYVGWGGEPLSWAYGSAGRKTGCVFTVAPRNLPIWSSPFDHDPKTMTTGTGVDHARNLYAPVLGMMEMNNHGQDRTGPGGWIDDHDAYDYNMKRGTPIYAPASGRVLDARWLNTTCTGSDDPVQGEIYLNHAIARNPSTYNETFVSSYFHLQELVVEKDDWVNQGDLIGYSGHTGCSSQPHLHFATMRLSNTARNYKDTLSIPEGVGNDGYRITIDPYGFDAPNVFDPWSWQAYYPQGNWPGGGALSVNLWREGEAPPSAPWN